MMQHEDTTDRILAAFYKVYNTLGFGFLEKVYENAMAIELRKRGLHYSQQHRIQVFYDGVVVGDFAADIFVLSRVMVELKSVERLSDGHKSQLVNYLRSTECEVGLLLNFGPKPEVKRVVFSNTRKTSLVSDPRESVVLSAFSVAPSSLLPSPDSEDSIG
jgi:GxxExxY protein